PVRQLAAAAIEEALEQVLARRPQPDHEQRRAERIQVLRQVRAPQLLAEPDEEQGREQRERLRVEAEAVGHGRRWYTASHVLRSRSARAPHADRQARGLRRQAPAGLPAAAAREPAE